MLKKLMLIFTFIFILLSNNYIAKSATEDILNFPKDRSFIITLHGVESKNHQIISGYIIIVPESEVKLSSIFEAKDFIYKYIKEDSFKSEIELVENLKKIFNVNDIRFLGEFKNVNKKS